MTTEKTSAEEYSSPAHLRGHVPVLDGVRGLAILLVLGLHVAVRMNEPENPADWWIWQVIRTGWTGVDLFFVLSGFLITGILSDSRSAENYFGSFYGRRALRIFPLYYGFLIALWVGGFFLRSGEYPLGMPAFWYFFYIQNYLMFAPGELVMPGVLGITWSLAVEEQFYLFWPLLVRRLSHRAMIRLAMIVLVVQSPVRALLYYFVDPAWLGHAYAVTPTHMDGLAVGALVALVIRTPGGLARVRAWARVALPVGLIGAVVCFVLTGDVEARQMPFGLYGYSFIALLYGSILVFAISSEQGNAASRMLSGSFLRTWGKYSYAVYLLHAPAIRLAEKIMNVALWNVADPPSLLGSQLPAMMVHLVFSGALALLFAWMSWHVLEKRFLALKDRFAIRKSAA